MALHIQRARRPGALRALFELRHQVFVEEEGFLAPSPGGVLADLYDALDITANFCAQIDGTLVGGVRVTLDSEAGLPVDAAYPMRNHVPPDARLASCGRMCVTRTARTDERPILHLLRLSMYWAKVQGCTHLCGVVNPTALELVARIGFAPVGAPFTTAAGLPSVPVVLHVDELAADYAQFARMQIIGHWLETFERWVYAPGDVIEHAGAPADLAWLVVEGQVAVQDGMSHEVLAHLTRGHAYGELALLEPARRRHTLVATAPTVLMGLSRQAFQSRMQADPSVVSGLLRALGRRFVEDLDSRRDALGPPALELHR